MFPSGQRVRLGYCNAKKFLAGIVLKRRIKKAWDMVCLVMVASLHTISKIKDVGDQVL